ncbi:MAG TPA: DUF429 domain-containing protein [Solirubrobacter sp.]
MLTLGVDLSSQDAKTAICRVRWDGEVRSVVDVDVGIGDPRILELSRTVDATGIDAPLGLSAVGGTVDRVHGPYYEVYPGAALVRWNVEAKGYKQDADVREKVLDALGPLEMTLADRTLLIASDHALDALLCALIAREAATGRTHHPPPELAGAAAREGWIHLPKPA